MSITLNRELEKLESDIRQAVIDSDEFLFAKLNRAKDELTQKIFFAESRNLKSELSRLADEQAAAFDLRKDFQTELTLQAEKVREMRSKAYDEQEKHNAINVRLHFLDNQIEVNRQTINDLQKELDLKVDIKLNPDRYDNSGNLKRTVKENE